MVLIIIVLSVLLCVFSLVQEARLVQQVDKHLLMLLLQDKTVALCRLAFLGKLAIL